MNSISLNRLLLSGTMIFFSLCLSAQTDLKLKYSKSSVYAGIEVGSKGVKMSLIEIGENAQSNGAFNILKDTSINTDFISFSQPTSQATLNGLYNLYATALKDYKIPANRVFTVVSSGVKMQAEKEKKSNLVEELIVSFRQKIKEPTRNVEVVDVLQEARLSHLGIVPNSKRYTTFLIDIGSGNSKGGYFPYGNTKDFKLFQLNWGTKSTANAAEKRLDETDKTLGNFKKQLTKVLSEAENTEIIYAVNESGSYPSSDLIAFSGGIVWSLGTLMHPELINNSIVPVTFDEVAKFNEKLYSDFASISDSALAKNTNDASLKPAIVKEVKRVHQVFDQKSLMSGTALLLKIMRQYSPVNVTKKFYLVKNGQVGWVSAYVDQYIGK